MKIDPAVLELIAQTYDSVLSVEAWPDILQRLGELADLRAVNIFTGDHSHHEVAVTAASRWVPIDVLREYGAEYIKYDAPALDRLSRHPPQVLVGVESLSPTPAPLARWLRNRLGIEGRFAVRLNDHNAWVDGMNLHLSHLPEVLRPPQRRTIETVLPHFAKAVEVSRPFHLLRARFQAVIAALDRFHMGVVVLDGEGHVVIRNKEADRIIELNDGFTLDRNGRPALSGPAIADAQALSTAIADAIATASGAASVPERRLAIRRRSRDERLIVEVSPLTGAATELPRGFKGALILLVDPTRTEVASTAGIEALYGLTPAESEVLGMVIAGLTTPSIADSRNTSPETVRTQIKAIFAKTRTQSRAALVRLALTVNLPIDPATQG